MIRDKFVDRHIGPRDHEVESMLKVIGAKSIEDLINQTIPQNIRLDSEMKMEEGISEFEYFHIARDIAKMNKIPEKLNKSLEKYYACHLLE